MPKTTMKHEITIHALTSKLWSVLTCSAYTRQFLFSKDFVSEWIEGSTVFSEANDTEQGIVQQVIPGMMLEFTLCLPEFSDQPIHCRYELVPEENGIRLKLLQELVLHKEVASKTMTEHCNIMLQKIKWLAEYS